MLKVYRACGYFEYFGLMLDRVNTPEAATSNALELPEHVEKSLLELSVYVGYPYFLAPVMQKKFHVLVLHVGVLLRSLGPVDRALSWTSSMRSLESGCIASVDDALKLQTLMMSLYH